MLPARASQLARTNVGFQQKRSFAAGPLKVLNWSIIY